jgi:hypothetical protein
MARMRTGQQVGQIPLGISPTMQQKLIYIAKKLNLQGIEKMQGSTVTLVDTIQIQANPTARQTLSFFTQTQNKSRNFSNFQNGSLNSGETLIIEEISFILIQLNAANLTSDATQTLQFVPASSSVGNGLSNPVLVQGLTSVTIANQKVVKDLSTFEQDPNYNPRTVGISEDVSVNQSKGQNKIFLESAPVLPPNQKFEITLELPPLAVVTDIRAIQCIVGRFGSIFASRTTL